MSRGEEAAAHHASATEKVSYSMTKHFKYFHVCLKQDFESPTRKGFGFMERVHSIGMDLHWKAAQLSKMLINL